MRTFKITITPAIAQQHIEPFIFKHGMASASFEIQSLSNICFYQAVASGWYIDAKTGEQLEINLGERIALMHSELSEALEGARKDLPSDKIPEFSALEEEFADCIIRILDTSRALNLRLGDAFVAKLAYNRNREDHKIENRAKEDGKQF